MNRFASLTVRRMFSLLYYRVILAQGSRIVKAFFAHWRKMQNAKFKMQNNGALSDFFNIISKKYFNSAFIILHFAFQISLPLWNILCAAWLE